LGYRNGDIVLRQSGEAASVDDGIGNGLVECDDDIVDDPTRSSLSLNTGCPTIWRLALHPLETSRISVTLTPMRVEPATCACEMVGAVSAMLASTKM
jgi:hypothetical protein